MFGTPMVMECRPLNNVPAFKYLQLGELIPQHSLQILEDSREEPQQLQQLLFGGTG